MIQNLNFYDIYGYLIPGLTLSILIWLPAGLIERCWPTVDWASALVAVVIAYVVGHVVSVLALNAVPPTTMAGRFPSDVLLDRDDKNFSAEFKERLRDRIKKLSGIDVMIDLDSNAVTGDVTGKAQAQRREGAFFCRDALVTSKTISYAEQMQGMYALMNGLTVAFALGAAYDLGWALSGIAYVTLQKLAWILVGLGLAGAIVVALHGLRKKADPSDRARMLRARWAVCSVMLALTAAGYIAGLGKVSSLDQCGQLGAITLALTFVSLTCLLAYKYFTLMYALTIYRLFIFYEKPDKAAETK
jgi:hypothetical protein